MHNEAEVLQHATQFMPTDESSDAILQKRANLIATYQEVEKSETDLESYIKFIIGDNELYGMPFSIIKEVIQNVNITRMPFVPDYVAGVINHRGLLLSVISLQKFLNLPNVKDIKAANKVIIIVNHRDITLGFNVDNIEGADLYQASHLETMPPSLKTIKPNYIIGLHCGKVAILNIEAILSDILKELHRNV